MASKYQAPRGTFDVLPGEAVARSTVEHIAEAIFDLAGYAKISTPAFEDTDLFVRGVGRSTDIVQKEMFTFEDKGGRSVTLRPEGTAPICRAYVEHGMHKLAQPVKLALRRALLPPRAPPGGPLPAVPPDRRRGDRHRLAARRRRGDHPARRPPRHPRGARSRAAAGQPRLARRRGGPTSIELKALPARRTRRR